MFSERQAVRMIMKSKDNIGAGRREKYSFHKEKQGMQGEIILGSRPVLKATTESISSFMLLGIVSKYGQND